MLPRQMKNLLLTVENRPMMTVHIEPELMPERMYNQLALRIFLVEVEMVAYTDQRATG